MAIITQFSDGCATCKVASAVNDVRNEVSTVSDFLKSVASLPAFTLNGAVCGFLKSDFHSDILLMTAGIIFAVNYDIEIS